MSAPPATEPQVASSPKVNWPVPPPEGFSADDLDRIPDLPSHTELIDGSLVFVTPQKLFHWRVIRLLERRLAENLPEHLLVRGEMTVTIGPKQRPEPDVLVVRAESEESEDVGTYPPDAVLLAVEVVSPDSMVRDRERKPQIYAQAGIPHFWRVENDGGEPKVYVYELDPATRTYVARGIHEDRLKVSSPFEIDIDLTEMHRM
ncbi:Uma2 family endonuclease [Lipingzhangella halophila]|uniref:Uma2 family endonuclease n=1 Tax=Lipingzhangella halophila TaxID=1783352 RepID=A0A7W7RCD8_9ACTN|nr:Uma2 family endonuclease [Lipingzhangella halophila]MBB4929402.1 Uma2 family endonuclease [Lipingzhangella halophila]